MQNRNTNKLSECQNFLIGYSWVLIANTGLWLLKSHFYSKSLLFVSSSTSNPVILPSKVGGGSS